MAVLVRPNLPTDSPEASSFSSTVSQAEASTNEVLRTYLREISSGKTYSIDVNGMPKGVRLHEDRLTLTERAFSRLVETRRSSLSRAEDYAVGSARAK